MERSAPPEDNAAAPPTVRSQGPRPGAIAALDLGTNNCRLLVARPRGAGFQVIDSFSRAVRLGEGVEETGTLAPRAIERALDALAVCADKVRRNGVRRMRAVATEACRRASNGRAFLDMARARTGLRLDLITAEEEARLAVAGCAPLLDEAAEQVLVIDIGGGSTELVWMDLSGTPGHLRPRLLMALAPVRRGVLEPDDRARAAAQHIVDWISAPCGVATLHDRFAHLDHAGRRFEAMTTFFEAQVAAFAPRLGRREVLAGLQIIGASGTVTTIAGAHLGLRRYDRSRVDGFWLPVAAAERVIAEMVALDDAARARHPSIGADRSLLIVAGAAILSAVFRLWPTERLRVADRGLREGLLYAMLGEGQPAPGRGP